MTDACAGARVLHRDAALLMLYKPAGLPTTSPNQEPCLAQCAEQLDPRAPHLHASSRLDAEVTGVVTFARTRRAIAGLLEARRLGRYERYYLALASAAPEPSAGEWHFRIDRDPRDPRRRVSAARESTRGVAAATRYRLLHPQPSAALMLLMPQTGRTHQLRVHAARAGLPLLGDRHYGGPSQRVLPDGRVLRAGRVMLHCARVRLPNLARDEGTLLTIDAAVPDDFRTLWQKLGGDAALLEPAAWVLPET